MLRILLTLLRYIAATVILIIGIIFVPLPLPFGIPLILLAIALFAGSFEPVRRILAWIARLFRKRDADPDPGDAA